MNNLPTKINNNFFHKINKFFKSILIKEKRLEYEKKENLVENKKNDFQGNIKVKIKEGNVLEKVDKENKRKSLLEEFAKNPESLEYIPMDKLILLEKMYDEELNKIPKDD